MGLVTRLNRHGPVRRLIYVRLAFLVVALVAVLAFHVSGTTLVIFRVVKWVLVAAVLIVLARIRARRQRGS
jgi:hypothetical protein